jgi:uncharacterized protein YaiE (UPF0345 family)
MIQEQRPRSFYMQTAKIFGFQADEAARRVLGVVDQPTSYRYEAARYNMLDVLAAAARV